MPAGSVRVQSHTAHHPIDPGITFRPEDHLAPRYTPHGERRPGARGSTTELTAGGSEMRTLGPPTAVSSVVAPSTRSSLRDKGAGAGAGVQQTTDLLINAPHIKCWSSCPVTWGPRSRSIHARSRAATSRTRWTRRRSRRRVRIASTGRGRFGSVGRRGSEDRPGFRYVLIAHSSAAFRASRTASFFLIAAISLRILCNSLWDFLLSKYSEPSCATMYRSNWLLRTLR